MSRMRTPRVQPLRVRPGTRYACFGDGLCCTDIHVIGPLRGDERAMLAALVPAAVADHPDGSVLLPTLHGTCPFLVPAGASGRSGGSAPGQAVAGVCAIHARLGPRAKPRACTAFPFGLVATPAGGRATTSHRCPCRTLGDRPPVTASIASAALRGGGRAHASVRVEDVIELRASGEVTFAEYEDVERDVLRALAGRGAQVESLARLAAAVGRRRGAPPRFPRLTGASWRSVGHTFARADTSSSYGATLAWLGHALLAIHVGRHGRWPPRPWAARFERAATRLPRTPTGGAATAGGATGGGGFTPGIILADWAADEVWGLAWTSHATLAQLLEQLAALVAIGERIVRTLRQRGVRPEAAEAEAVTILELAAGSELWLAVQHAWPAR
jgi:hypothetical protein